MVKRLFRAITGQVSGLQKAAFWLAFFSALSIILGFLRDRLLAHYFGAGQSLDIYYAAFEIPDLLFATIGSLVSASILVPIFSKNSETRTDLRKLVDAIFSSFFILLSLACLAAFIFMPELVHAFFRGFKPEMAARVVVLSRILLLSPFFLGISNFFASIVQLERRFLLYSLSPLFYNASIIGFLFFGASSLGVEAAIIGVAIGALLHMSIQGVFVFSSPEAPRLSLSIFSKEVRKIFLLSIPRTISLSISSLVGLFFVSLASKLASGSIAVFTLAFNLQSVLLSLIGSSFSLAAFPTLAEHHAKKEVEALIKCMSQGLRHIIFWSLPISGLFIVLRAHIVRVVLGSGAFSWSDTRMTAAALALFVCSIVFQSLQLFLTRAHYAFGQTRTPLIMNIAGAAFTSIIALLIFHFSGLLGLLIPPIASALKVADLTRTAVLVLPLSFSLGSALSSILLWVSLEKSIRKEIITPVMNALADAMFASASLLVISVLALRIFNDYLILDTTLNVFLHGLLSGLAGLVAAIGVLYLLKNQEIQEITGRIK